MDKRFWATVTVVLLAGALHRCGAAAPIKMLAPAEYPHAGITLAVPEGFQYRPLGRNFDVLRAELFEGNLAVQAVTLSAFPVSGKTNARTCAEKMVAEMKNDLAVRNLKVLKTAAMTVADIAGTAQRMSYTYRGVEIVAARVFFLRRIDKPDAAGQTDKQPVHICYVLTVECAAEKQATMLPILGEVIRTVRLTAVRHPTEVKIKFWASPLKDSARGYSVRPPRGWYATLAPGGLEMAQTDYLAGGEPMQVAMVRVAEEAGETTGKAAALKCLEIAKKAAAERQAATKVLSEGPAGLGGRTGYQFVLRLVAKAQTQPTTAPVQPPIIIIQRVACITTAGGQRKRYSLILHCVATGEQQGRAMMEKIASGFEFLTPASGPTTSTAPADTAPAENN